MNISTTVMMTTITLTMAIKVNDDNNNGNNDETTLLVNMMTMVAEVMNVNTTMKMIMEILTK